ncbi:multiheme c-type cytochrome [Aliiruegeria lutimaris]|uniref:Cytochrome c554 and c-prime n=1 Tax=Aliiruegeria lutimaris TaxID=571298 RepID=A0A1G8IIZ8_9RHOB|nr:multiheme c-type cytochrome [Aliiruegeria lutimaris]SDI18757.1 Cytochrome c554 and c-prime [Aliiruegeria lutimaris]
MPGHVFLRLTVAVGLAATLATTALAQSDTPAQDPAVSPPATAAAVPVSTADHSRFDALAGPFTTAQEVNEACLPCHNTGPEQLHGTLHFSWSWPAASSGQAADASAMAGGMLHVANGFLLSTPSNLDACSSCHIAGTRFEDPAVLDASSAPVAPVDCMSCHEPTGQWTVANFHEDGAACSMCHDERLRGDTPEVKDFVLAAKSVGPSTNASCGACHFNADGGQGVKHGDLNADLLAPPPTLDVHMAAAPEGAGFTCSTCHTTTEHALAGSRYAGGPGARPESPALVGAAASCQGCHGAMPHDAIKRGVRLDRHISTVACETCHIPSIARGETATRVFWDWSTVGKLGRDRKPMAQKQKDGRITYTTEKGHLEVARSFAPDYIWSDGMLDMHRPGTPLPATGATEIDGVEPGRDASTELALIKDAFADAPWIASYSGEPVSEDARIVPVKIMHSVVPIDAENRALASVKFSGRSGDALWNRFRWENAVEAGMEAAGQPFSGEVAFTPVRQMIPVNHMVAPAEVALQCPACHSSDGLLEELPGGFLPGRDRYDWLDKAGLLLLAGTLGAVLFHLVLRLGFALFHRGKRHG